MVDLPLERVRVAKIDIPCVVIILFLFPSRIEDRLKKAPSSPPPGVGRLGILPVHARPGNVEDS